MPIKKRILFIHLGYAFGGIEVYMQRLAQLLAEDAEVFAICSHPELQEGLEAQGVRVSSIPMIKGMLRPLRFLALLIMLPVWIIRNRIDVVHINGYWESILLLPARLCGAKAISTRHLTYDIQLRHWYEAPKRTLASLIYNANARFANEVTCVSEAVATEVRTIVNPNRVSVIPNWMDDIPDYRVRTVDVSRPIRLLFVGRMVIFKGLHILLQALQDISPQVELTVVGEGPLRQQFEQQASNLNVRFLGFQRNVQKFYETTDIFVMPSIGLEGLPLVSLEAMAHSVPCLFSDLAVHREITNNGEAAVLFQTGDPADLSRRLQELITDLSHGITKTKQAHDLVRKHYSASTAKADTQSCSG